MPVKQQPATLIPARMYEFIIALYTAYLIYLHVIMKINCDLETEPTTASQEA